MTYTPGPWVVEYPERGGIRVSGPSNLPADEYPWLIAETISRQSTDEANARLISAAPDLLEAATHFGACEFAGTSIEFRCEGCMSARAAIAKAEGQ